jgi:uncharacterized protein
MSKKFTVIILVLVGLTIVVVYSWSINYSWQGNKKTIIVLKGQKITAEIVSSQNKMEEGLSGRKGLCDKCGMLFLLEKKGFYTFWMKDMKFDLDLIWLDGYSIVGIDRNVSKDFPGTMKSDLPANKVLELPAGFTDKYGIVIGDRIEM